MPVEDITNWNSAVPIKNIINAQTVFLGFREFCKHVIQL